MIAITLPQYLQCAWNVLLHETQKVHVLSERHLSQCPTKEDNIRLYSLPGLVDIEVLCTVAVFARLQ